MNKLAVALAASILALSATAFAQMAPTGPVVDGPAQPAQTGPQPRFAPQPIIKGQDLKGLMAAVAANNQAWAAQDPVAITNAWIFPASIVTTDAQANPVAAQVDAEAAKSAFGSLFSNLPKATPGVPGGGGPVSVKFSGQKVEWLSNNLAIVTQMANVTQGAGKMGFHQMWRSTQTWSRDAQGNWRVRAYVGSGWGDLIKH